MGRLADHDEVTLDLRSDPRSLCLVRAVVGRFVHLAGFDDRRTHAITLAVDEGCANMIRHSYRGRDDGEIRVTLSVRPDGAGGRRLVIRLRDRGEPADPELVRAPRPADPRRPGGLGLHLMHDAVDSVEPLPCDGDGNVIELRVACPDRGPG